MAIESDGSAAFGWSGFLVSALALVAAVTVFWAGPFAPQQSTGVALGDLAAEIGQAAKRRISGAPQPAPEPVSRDIDDMLQVAVGVLAALGVILGLAGIARGERRRVGSCAVALGAGAIGLQFLFWWAMALLGVLLVWAVLDNLEGVFGGLFGG